MKLCDKAIDAICEKYKDMFIEEDDNECEGLRNEQKPAEAEEA